MAIQINITWVKVYETVKTESSLKARYHLYSISKYVSPFQ